MNPIYVLVYAMITIGVSGQTTHSSFESCQKALEDLQYNIPSVHIEGACLQHHYAFPDDPPIDQDDPNAPPIGGINPPAHPILPPTSGGYNGR